MRPPPALTGGLVAVVKFMMASATSGKVDFEGAIEAVTAGEALNLASASSFDAANGIAAPTVPAVAGYVGQFTITLPNADGPAAGDLVRFSLKRDATDATNDTATGDCYVLAGELRHAA